MIEGTIRILKKTKIIRFILISLLFFTTSVFSQNNEDNKPEKRIFTGGNFGIQFGTITSIDISPIIGYRITNNFAVGLGAAYLYFKDTRPPQFETNIYGGRIFARYYFTTDNFLENVFIHTEYELLNLDAYVFPNFYDLKRINVPLFFIGGGYQQPISDNSYLTILVLWDFIEDINSPYINPVIRAGINVGI